MPKPKATLIVVSDGFGGYGDFLFALKLAQNLKNKYKKQGLTPPPFYIVTQSSGRDKIRELGGDVEYDTAVLTPDELKRHLQNNDFIVEEVIEAPIFSENLISKVDKALWWNRGLNPPLTMIYEYGIRNPKEIYAYYRKYHLKSMHYAQEIKTGIERNNQQGILLTDNQDSSDLAQDLDANIADIIGNNDSNTILSMQYSHDIYEAFGADRKRNYPAKQFLEVHRQFYKNYNKNQDVLLVGPNMEHKVAALKSVAQKLIGDGYTLIEVYDATTGTNEILYNSGEPGKRYRAIYAKSMTHESMLACTSLSGPLVGVTGDQSFGEALSSNKLFTYEALDHKLGLLNSYFGVMLQAAGDDTDVQDVLELLHMGCAYDNNQYDRNIEHLGVLFQKPGLIEKLHECNNVVISQHDLVQHFMNKSRYYIQAIENRIFELVRENKNQEALDLYNLHKELFSDNSEIHTETNTRYIIRKLGLNAFLNNCVARPPVDELKMIEVLQIFQIKASSQIDIFPGIKWALLNECYSVAEHLIKNAQSTDEIRLICENLQVKDKGGETYLTKLCRAKPPGNNPTTQLACYWSTIFRLKQYKPTSERRMKAYQSFQELVKVYGDSATEYNQDALICLLLINMKNIASEKWFFSPENLLFGSKLYYICNEALRDLGVNLNKITPEERAHYSSALNTILDTDPNLRANHPILNTLASYAQVSLPAYRPMVSEKEIDRILSPDYSSRKEDVLKPKKNAKYFYKLNKKEIGSGGWGIVYQAERHPPGRIVAIKKMNVRHNFVLEKERALFQQAHPDEPFEQFTIGDNAYLEMPLYKGVQLARYLTSHGDLSTSERGIMAVELLRDLAGVHARQVTHNDLKVKNIIFDPVAKKMRIVDFGCAEDLNSPNQLKFESVDTSVFAFEFPPEYLAGTTANATLDMYSMAPLLAEILGINKRRLVEKRLDKALEGINPDLAELIRTSYQPPSEQFEEIFFTSPLYQYINIPEFNRFVKSYTNTPYDFAMYEKKLGRDMVVLLDEMQARDPSKRPTAKDCLERLNKRFVNDIKEEIQQLKEQFKKTTLGDDDANERNTKKGH
jgi:serine/threonine protein kinase